MPIFSSQNELAAFLEVVKLCHNKLDGYPRTLTEDLELLDQLSPISFIQRNSIQITVEEKTLLHSLIATCSNIINLLQMKKEDAIYKIEMSDIQSELDEFLMTLDVYLFRELLPVL